MTKNWGDRVPLSIAISNDGITWNKLYLEKVSDAKNTDKEEYSYPFGKSGQTTVKFI